MSQTQAANGPSATLAPSLVPSRADDAHQTHLSPRESLPDWIKVRGLALRQLNRFISLEPKVLKGDDPDAIHDLRVSSRRLQQVLDLLYPAPPKEVRRLRRKIRSSRRALSEVRNYDVNLARAQKRLASRRTSRRDAWEAISDYLVERRAESFERALRKLSKANLAVAYVRLKEHLDWGAAAVARNGHVHPPDRPIALPEELASEPFAWRVRAALEKVWRAYEAQIADSRRDPEAPALHGARIATKRLRYLVEVLHAFDVAGSVEVLGSLRKLQRHLGDWHDLEVFDQMLIEMVARPKFLRDHLETAMALEKLIVRNRRAKKGYVEEYFGMTVDSAESRRLKDWIESLLSRSSEALAEV